MGPFIQVSCCTKHVFSYSYINRSLGNIVFLFYLTGLKAAITTLKMLRPSTIESSDEGDTDAARHQMHGLVVRYLMGINIATSVRTVKIFTVASLGYFLFKRFLKDYANELVGNFLKGSN